MTLYDVYGECLQLTNMTTAMAAAATRGHGTIQVVIHNGGSGDHEDHKDVFYHNKGGGDCEGNEGNEWINERSIDKKKEDATLGSLKSFEALRASLSLSPMS